MSPATVLVTGSSSGLGRQTAEGLARRGHMVFASMRDVSGKNARVSEELRALARAEGLALEVVELDVTDSASVAAAVQTVVEHTGRIDVVINNAGYGTGGISEAITLEQAQRQFDVNLFGVLRVNQAVLPYMRQQRSGLLVYISSIAGQISHPMLAMYSATKAALDAMARSFAFDLREFGIDTTILQAGGFTTDFGINMLKNANQAVWQTYGTTAQVADAFCTMMNAPMNPDMTSPPQLCSDQLAELIALPQGSRPLYLPLGAGSHLLLPINQANQQAERAMLELFQMNFFLGPTVPELATAEPAIDVAV